jgi:uncharacterized protein YukE
MNDLTISSGFIEGVAIEVASAADAVHLSLASTTSGVDGLESTQAIAALNESTAERMQRAKLSAEALTALARSTQLVADKMSETDHDLARSAKSQ